jgi:putative Holliday junction resolvase
MGAADRFPGVLMGIDWGGRRVGVALSDPSRTLARPLVVLVREGSGTIPLESGERVIGSLLKIAADHEVTGLVVGIPYYHLSGDSNPHAPLFLSVARELSRELALPLFLCDEGQSTETARDIRRGRGGRRGHSLGMALGMAQGVDHLAAATLLQGFLDAPASAKMPVAARVLVTGGEP